MNQKKNEDNGEFFKDMEVAQIQLQTLFNLKSKVENEFKVLYDNLAMESALPLGNLKKKIKSSEKRLMNELEETLNESFGTMLIQAYSNLSKSEKLGYHPVNLNSTIQVKIRQNKVQFNPNQSMIIKKIFEKIPCLNKEKFFSYLVEIKLKSGEKSFSKRLFNMWYRQISKTNFYFPNEKEITARYIEKI